MHWCIIAAIHMASLVLASAPTRETRVFPMIESYS
jgi:hypothetical protein